MSEKKEYIERGAALELFWKNSGNWSLINAIPTADVEPVVRCKDCAKRRTHLCNMCKPVKDDEFCSDGATRIIKDYERAAHMERSGSGE